jgi:hypothetical protein
MFRQPDERRVVGICPAGPEQLAVAVADLRGHPFDLEPALLDAERVEQLRDALTAWLQDTCRPRPT